MQNLYLAKPVLYSMRFKTVLMHGHHSTSITCTIVCKMKFPLMRGYIRGCGNYC